jgi:D-sedoheptulose 7-phosphate isomerase
MNSIDILKNNIIASIDAKAVFLNDTVMQFVFSKAVEKVLNSYRNGGRVYIAGNGGSAADAQHLAAEFVSKLAKNRRPIAAEALTTDSSILTAIGNDYGFDEIFARQIECKAKSNDVFIGITTSGNSKNILKALEMCRRINVVTIIFAGHDGGSSKKLADYCILVPGDRTSVIQEIHILLAHTLCECIENGLF